MYIMLIHIYLYLLSYANILCCNPDDTGNAFTTRSRKCLALYNTSGPFLPWLDNGHLPQQHGLEPWTQLNWSCVKYLTLQCFRCCFFSKLIWHLYTFQLLPWLLMPMSMEKVWGSKYLISENIVMLFCEDWIFNIFLWPWFAYLSILRLAHRGWRLGGSRFKSHPRLNSQSWSSYQLNQLESKAASDSTLKQSTTCGVSNTVYFTFFSPSKHKTPSH